MKKLKSKLSKLKIKFKSFITKLVRDYIIIPLTRKKLARLQKESIQNLKKNFEKDFNTDISKLKQLMYSDKKQQTSNEYLNSQLVKARQYLNQIDIKPTLNFDPQLIEEHNTDPNRSTYPSIQQIKEEDNKIAERLFSEEKNTKIRENRLKGKVRWITRG